jgi:hypothetical protein
MRREDFPQRVGEQEEVGLRAAEAHVRAVFAVLDEAVSGSVALAGADADRVIPALEASAGYPRI